MRTRITLIAVLCLAGVAWSQQPGLAPQPGPEHEKLAIWIGDWQYEGQAKESPLGPAGKFSGQATARPILGGFFVELRGHETSPLGDVDWVETYGYDPVGKKYTWTGFASDGSATVGTWTLDGATNPYTGTMTAAGTQYRIRGTAVSADFMSFLDKQEISTDGKTWAAFVERKYTKVKAAPATGAKTQAEQGVALDQVALVAPSAPSHATANYGDNAAAGDYFTHDGVKLYYEVYGTGEPLLVIHGNGGRIAAVREQIAYFRKHYKVIAMDSRDRGKSDDSPNKITYEKMADDWNALLVHLNTGPAYVLGWSDGAIEALLLAQRHPEKVKKIAAMAANLNPTDEALYPELIAWLKQSLAAVPDAQKDTPQWRHTAMMLEEPHIDPKALEAITAPTLVLAGDHDAIRDEHTLEIYHHLPNGALAIFPHATHMIPVDDPQTFNATVDRFFRTTFVKIDRMGDTLKSIEKQRGGAKK